MMYNKIISLGVQRAQVPFETRQLLAGVYEDESLTKTKKIPKQKKKTNKFCQTLRDGMNLTVCHITDQVKRNQSLNEPVSFGQNAGVKGTNMRKFSYKKINLGHKPLD